MWPCVAPDDRAWPYSLWSDANQIRCCDPAWPCEAPRGTGTCPRLSYGWFTQQLCACSFTEAGFRVAQVTAGFPPLHTGFAVMAMQTGRRAMLHSTPVSA